MKASELITQLQELIQQHGDLEVWQFLDAYPDSTIKYVGYEPSFTFGPQSIYRKVYTVPERFLIQ